MTSFVFGQRELEKWKFRIKKKEEIKKKNHGSEKKQLAISLSEVENYFQKNSKNFWHETDSKKKERKKNKKKRESVAVTCLLAPLDQNDH